MSKYSLLLAASVAGFAIASSAVQAQQLITETYTTTVPEGAQGYTPLPHQGSYSPVIFGNLVFGYTQIFPGVERWFGLFPGGYEPNPPAQYPYANGFDMTAGTSQFSFMLGGPAPTAVVIVGVHADDPNNIFDVSTDHLVLMVNNRFANSARGKSFSSVMSQDGITEQDLIQDVLSQYQNEPDHVQALYQVTQFVTDNGASIGFGFPGRYTGVTFSDGASYGEGTASLQSSTPEPASWALMIAGFGLAGAAIRRRRASAAASTISAMVG